MIYQVYRTNISSYHSAEFLNREAKAFQKIGNFVYASNAQDLSLDKPIILITNTKTKLNALSKKILEQTQLIIHPNSGFDNFSCSISSSALFPVVLGNQIRGKAVSEYIISLLFHHYTKIIEDKKWPMKRTWNRPLLAQKKVLLIGHGHIGKQIHNILGHLCESVDIYDPYQGHADFSHLKKTSFDIMITCCSYHHSNESFIDEQFFSLLNSDGVFINSARGKLLNEEALLDFLEQFPLAYAYLDTFSKEPLPIQHPFYKHPQIHKTGHKAGVFGLIDDEIINFETQVAHDFTKFNKNTFYKKYAQYLLENRPEFLHATPLQ